MAGALSNKKTAYLLLLASLALVVVLNAPTLQNLAAFSLLHLLVCFVCAALSAVGMEFYARWAHRDLWHGPLLWWVHETHHGGKKERDVFELNDIFGVANVVVVVPIMMWAIWTPLSVGTSGLLGFTIGISVFGTGYMVVHDGVHHGRFPAKYFAQASPWIQRVAAAHAEHHKQAMGPPYGMFLGPHELEAKAAGKSPEPAPPWLLAANLACAVGTLGCLLIGV